MTSKYEGPKLVAAIMLAFAAIPYGWWANAFALKHIWNWYIPPFAPVMPFKVALGASFVVWVLLSSLFRSRKSKDKEADDFWTELWWVALMPWLVLGFARISLWVFFE